MKTTIFIKITLPVFLLLITVTYTMAGPYGDSLTKCLERSTTEAEKITLVKWIFQIISLHPQVGSTSALTDRRASEVNKQVANIFQALLTKRCLDETRNVVRNEKRGVLGRSFNQLGQIAARELFEHEDVQNGMMEMVYLLDLKAIEEILRPPK